MERRLAAILAADVVGYSRMMAADEAGTFAALKARRKEVLEPLVAKHRGRIFKLMGDSAFVEFGSAVAAVECALGLRKGFSASNNGLPPERQVELRIGINLADVLVDGGDLYGDGVNLAARLQETADPGGICVSAKVQAEIAGTPGLVVRDLGERQLKNIAQPMRVFSLLDGAAASQPAAPPAKPATPKPEAFAVKPAVAVLPFLNMSGEAEQEFFADGLTEDILTELSRFRDLFVTSRNSSFKYKGKAVDVQQAARELGVHYVVEGSVRKAGKRVRVTVQLIDAETDHHLWAERYDRDLEDIFAIQDEVTAAIVSTLAGRVEAASRDRAQHKRTENMAAYECLLAGKTPNVPSSSTRPMPMRMRGGPASWASPGPMAGPRTATPTGRRCSANCRRHWRSTTTTATSIASCRRSLSRRASTTGRPTIRSAPSASTRTTTSSSCSRASS